MKDKHPACPDCQTDGSGISRRDFIRTTAAGVSVAAAGGLASPLLAAGKSPAVEPETRVAQLYKSLTPEQKKAVCFSFDDQLRNKIDNNWYITPARINKDFDKDQQELIREIFVGLHSEEYVDKVMQQIDHDNRKGGLGSCSIALFGEPGTGKFEFVLAGRHVTRRCDGDSVAGAAFGGPIFYGHAAQGFNEKPDHPGNVYWYQAKRANELFQALDGKQRKLALRTDARDEIGTETVALRGEGVELGGIPFSELSKDQLGLAEQTIADVLAPFRKADVDECMKLIKASGMEKLHMSYYSNMDVGKDGVWDVWQIEGPNMVWYFRGDPHVHTWVHIRDKA